MKTLKRFLKSIVFGVFLLIPISAIFSVGVWFFGHIVFSMDIGKIEIIWRDSYLISLFLDLLRKINFYWTSYSKLREYAKAIDIQRDYVEEAWWELGFRRVYGNIMFTWDQKDFLEVLAAARTSKQIGAFVRRVFRL